MRNFIRQRSEFFATIRSFFAARNVLEVDTPLLTAYGVSDPHIVNVCCNDKYLITSPEYAMKKLLARGSGDIYQLSHVFRGAEHGKRHRGEFMLLEWYRCAWDHLALMDEVLTLVKLLLPNYAHYQRDNISYRHCFRKYFNSDVLALDDLQLNAFVNARISLNKKQYLDRQTCLDLLYGHFIENNLGRGQFQFVTQYPREQAALAKIIIGDDELAVAARFELYLEGIELCNGYWELNDPKLQRERFIIDNQIRARNNLTTLAIDEDLLQLLPSMPPCSGVALGIDRLLMLKCNENDIARVADYF